VALHGALSQAVRNRRLQALREGRVQILVATDVAARGIDVPTITHVFNYGLPMKAEDYTHRIGRTGRAGRDGLAITFAEFRDRRVEAVATVVVVRAALVAATAKVSATSAKAVSMTDLRVVVPVMSLPRRGGTLLRLGETSVPLHASRPLENRWASSRATVARYLCRATQKRVSPNPPGEIPN
jgi:superfamily II DNA helicase RecQ